ncbi:hypothetical protein C8Q75DRAFT_795498 [Abortiporus biennis]|nr:hypothetical protein C8Q75DRAFT_795498 [Abortiporus biennis]
MPPSIARWTLLSKSLPLARSSHAVSVTPSGHLLTYGGELKPRTPVDSTNAPIHIFNLSSAYRNADVGKEGGDGIPESRVGATAVWNEGDKSVYMWGGRGGVDMAPLSLYQSGVWRASIGGEDGLQSVRGNEGEENQDHGHEQVKWERVVSLNDEEAPESRSYHCAVTCGGEMFIHAGCPTSGRLSTLHSFDLKTHTWSKLSDGPEPPRGGTSLAATMVNKSKVLLRFGGFSGAELPDPSQPGIIDIYSVTSNIWFSSIQPSPDPKHGYPGPRSVHGFTSFSFSSPAPASPLHDDSQVKAILYHGEKDASSLGHAGAGVFWDDVWVLSHDNSLDSLSITEGWSWKRLEVVGDEKPEGRGWFPPSVWKDEETQKDRVVMFGGLVGNNERKGELWVLDVQ